MFHKWIVLGSCLLAFCGRESKPVSSPWTAPDSSSIPSTEEGDLIRYGQRLVSNTSAYFGPRGTVDKTSNGMTCQNCHLNAGTKPWGNNFGAVYSTYPRFRERRGAIESIPQRVTDCFERSLNGRSPDSNSVEMKAFVAYLRWLGRGVPKGKKPEGSGLATLPFPRRAADTAKGRMIFLSLCQSCHGPGGGGQMAADSIGYVYPPLWGEHSYNTAAGLYRISRLAGFIKFNMPFGTDYRGTRLTDEQAWDVAAFVNSQPRPQRSFASDWPNISLKPFDHPFGPYADSFSESQHKYGPFGPMQKRKK